MATARKDVEKPPQSTDPLEVAAQAQESASTALAVTEAQSKDIGTLKTEQVALAKLLNTLQGELAKLGTGDATKSVPAGVLARLEALEQATKGIRYDWGPQVEALNGQLSAVQTTLANQATSITEMLDKTGIENGGQFEELVRDIEDLKAGLATAADAITANARATAERPEVADVTLLSSAVSELSDRVIALERAGTPLSMELVTSAPGVLAKVQALMDEVSVIAKTREAKPESGSRGPRYHFRGIEDAMNAVGAGMRRVGLLMRPSVVNWEHTATPVTTQGSNNGQAYTKTLVWCTSLLTMRYTFVDPVDGSEFSLEMVGEGRDSSDKSASKAASMACKYGLFQALMVPFEGMDESDGHNPEIGWGPEGTPGQQVSRGTMSPAQAVNEYVRNSPNNPAADGNTDLITSAERAAKAARFIAKAQSFPAPDALAMLRQAKDLIDQYEIHNQVVDGLPLTTVLSTALQNVNAALASRSTGNTQGVSRAEQQAGDGRRAAAIQDYDRLATGDESDPEPGSREEYEAALAAMRSPSAPDEIMEQASRIVARYEDRDRDRQYSEQVDVTGRDGQW